MEDWERVLALISILVASYFIYESHGILETYMFGFLSIINFNIYIKVAWLVRMKDLEILKRERPEYHI